MEHDELQKKIKSVRLPSGKKRQRRFPFMTDVWVLMIEEAGKMLKYS